MSKEYWIIPVIVAVPASELEEVKARISVALAAYFHRHDIARPINPEWMNAENSPIKDITEADYALIKVGPEPKQI